jgi:4-amino-4-deoxy-L-arabinose transferase-like glycosyltransferase
VTAGERPAGRGRTRSIDIAALPALLALLALATALRLPDLATRGTFDGDQGTDALVVRTMIRDGVLPLLGPQTSIGAFHHGALYYYLLAPAGIPSGGNDPIALVALIATLGIAAVGVTWWLARSIAGPGAGLVAGLLVALSATAVEGSTFVWNPNPIPFFAAVALAAAWRARTSGEVRWWLLAGASQAMVQQLHVLGVLGLLPLAALWLDELRRSRDARRRLAVAGVAALGIIAVGYVPLLVYELGHDFSETRGALAWLTGAGSGASDGPGLLLRLVFVPLRVLAWPLVGPIVEAVAVSVAAVAAWSAAVVLAALRARGEERTALVWLGGSVALASILLAVGVRSLAVVTPLPSDHYHAFLWPAIAVAAGVAGQVLWRRRQASSRAAAVAIRAAVAAGIAALAIWNLGTQPPAVSPDGGWPAAEDAARRVLIETGDRPTSVIGVPAYKSTSALTYPLTVLGRAPVEPTEATRVAVLCDALFEEVVGLACRGPAEEARLAQVGITPGPVVARFEAAPGRWISIYQVAAR